MGAQFHGLRPCIAGGDERVMWRFAAKAGRGSPLPDPPEDIWGQKMGKVGRDRGGARG